MSTARLFAAVVVVGCQASAAPAPAPPPVPDTITPLALAAAGQPLTSDAAPPWTLTASDGSGLQLTRVDAKAIVAGPLAFTELHLYFHNAEPRAREGTFAITLPPGAAVSRFAMETDGAWQEAEVVDKALARRAYDDFLHRRQDPALLEKTAGNQFSARVFPIAAKADKHLVIAFSQDLPGEAYTLPLRGLPKIERVDVNLAVAAHDGAHRTETLSRKNWQPDRDFVATTPTVAAAVTAGPLVSGAVALGALGPATVDAPRELTLLVDTSASRGLGFASYVAQVHRLIDALHARYGDPLALQVIAFDQETRLIFDGAASNYGAAQDTALVARGAAGASDLGQALATIARPHRRVVVVTDGVMTAGADTPALAAAIKQLPIERLDVALAGGIRDEHLAAAIARAGLPHAGDVYDLDRGAAEVASGLGEPVRTDIALDVPGATWIYPKTIAAARPGQTVMFYARMARPTRTIDLVIGGERRMLVTGTAEPALVERAVAGAEIDELEAKLAATPDGTAGGRIRAEIAARSVRARVISSQTAMLVLESDGDYARYHIDRRSLADILVVGPHGLEQTHRTTWIARTPSTESTPRVADTYGAPELDRAQLIEEARSSGVLGDTTLKGNSDFSSGFDTQREDSASGAFGAGRDGVVAGGGGAGEGTIGLGRYGTIGHGSGTATGYGSGGGHGGMRAHSVAVPIVALAQPAVVSGSLDKAIIRRYIKRNIERLSYCYERHLLAHPTLAGTISVQFTIAANGRVTAAAASGLDAEIASCVADVIKSIEFPALPDGTGLIQVNYPFTFRPAGSASDAPPPPADPAARAFTPPSVEPPAPPVPAAATPRTPDEDPGRPALLGKLAEVVTDIRAGHADRALAIAKSWHDGAPGDVLALIALGEAYEAKHDRAAASRIYGSIIDLYPARADFRRFAGERLERVGVARRLAIDTYRKAVADRPDHLTGHRLLAYALLRDGDYAGALDAILAGVDQRYPAGRFAGGDRVLAEDAGMIAAAYIAHGGKRDEVVGKLAKRSLALADHPSTRFVLYWETDANDVDFHIRDVHGNHAWFSDRHLASGGDLYADVTTGYGPECFTIDGAPEAGPYRLSLNYFAQGPMGYGMGLVQIQRFDGKDIMLENRPYVIMTNQAFVDLGTYQP